MNQEILGLVSAIKVNHHPIVIIINDLPLQGQITTNLAANFGSRVKLNNLQISHNDISLWSKFLVKSSGGNTPSSTINNSHFTDSCFRKSFNCRQGNLL